MKIFITSTGTNIGKTLITTSIAYNFIKKNIDAVVLKPVISGWNQYSNDVYDILNSQNKEINEYSINKVNLYRFRAALSPNIAAKLENISINFDKIVEFCNISSKFTIIEGAGGIMSPITDNHTNLDLIRKLSSPIILVIGNYLGSISHTLTALEVIKYYNIKIQKIILTERKNDRIDINQIKDTLNRFTKNEIFCIPFTKGKDTLYRYLPEIINYDDI